MALTDLKSRIEDSVSPYFNSESSYTADMNQDGQKNDLIYIPNTKDELLFIDKNGFTAADQAMVDILNLDYLLNSSWGVIKSTSACNEGWLLQYEGVNDNNVPRFRCTTTKRNKTSRPTPSKAHWTLPTAGNCRSASGISSISRGVYDC